MPARFSQLEPIGEGAYGCICLAFDGEVDKQEFRKAMRSLGLQAPVEQIDGVIELGSTLYFVEMKWYRNPVGKPEISEHLVRLMSRAEVRGIFISASDYTDPAFHTVREFLQHKVLILSTLQELVHLLEQQDDLAEFFTKKVQAAQIHKNPYFRPHDGQGEGAL